MKYGVILLLLGAAQVILAPSVRWAGWLLLWSGLSWLLVGVAYTVHAPKALGKQAGGRLSRWAVVLFLPYFAATWILWHLQTMFSREPPHVEVAPGIWLGRRCLGSELPPGVKLVVDLTAEFAEPKAVRTGRTYLCVPALDGSVPSLAEFQGLMQTVAAFQEPIYIHCALGHGRSATVAVAALLARGNAASLAQAEQIVKSARPGIRIHNCQRRLLKQWSSVPVTQSSPGS